MFACIITAFLGAFQMPELTLPEINPEKSDILLQSLPHSGYHSEPLLLRGETPVLEDAVVRIGGYYRYALDLYLLDSEHYKGRIADNLDALSSELEAVGDQGRIEVERRLEEVASLKNALGEGLAQDSALKLFRHLDTEIRTLVGEYRPNGIYAYDMGNWATAMGIRIAFYPGCTDQLCQTLVLSNVNLLIEKVERDDSDNWNKVVLAMPREGIQIEDLISSIEFISGLPYYPIITPQTLDDLLTKLHVIYKLFDMKFVA